MHVSCPRLGLPAAYLVYGMSRRGKSLSPAAIVLGQLVVICLPCMARLDGMMVHSAQPISHTSMLDVSVLMCRFDVSSIPMKPAYTAAPSASHCISVAHHHVKQMIRLHRGVKEYVKTATHFVASQPNYHILLICGMLQGLAIVPHSHDFNSSRNQLLRRLPILPHTQHQRILHLTNPRLCNQSISMVSAS